MTAFLTWPIAATGAPSATARTLPDRLADIINVKDFGALGNGVHDDTSNIQAAFDAAFGSSTAPHGQSGELNRAVFFPRGNYLVSGVTALTVTAVKGGLIFGEGMYASRIFSTTAASVLFHLNGFGFSVIQDLGFENLGSGAVITLDYNWDNVVPMGSQNSAFINCFFGQNNANASSVVVAIGRDGFQADTSSFINCHITGANAGAGVRTYNFNALQITFVGGQILGCHQGILVPVGSVSVFNTYFSNRIDQTTFADYDIDIQGGGPDACTIQGSRSESYNFLRCIGASANVNVTGCSLNGEHAGHFVNAGCPIHVSNCWSKHGDIFVGGGGANLGIVTIENSCFNYHSAIKVNAANGVCHVYNTTLGFYPNGLTRYIIDQRTALGVVRTFGIEAANVSTDKNFLYENYGHPIVQNNVINNLPTTGTSVAFTPTTPTVLTFPDIHWFIGGEALAFSLVTTGSLPTGITADRVYFVTKDPLVNNPASQTTCHLSDTYAHAIAGTNTIAASSTGSGAINTWIARKYAVGDQVLNTGVTAGGSPGWICTTAGWAASVNAGETQAVFKALQLLGNVDTLFAPSVT